MIELNNIVPEHFSPDSKVWIYQADRLLGIHEVFTADELLQEFVAGWKSHGAPVQGFATIVFGQFIVIMADETATGVSGCSTDSSVHVVKKIEQELKLPFFNRTLLAFLINDKVQTLPLNQVGYALTNGLLHPTTTYFNNLVSTKEQFLTQWMQPIHQSWLAAKFNLPAVQ
ncbi:MAG: hypothetical protein EAY68_05020 [Bacteroidetes bacterium]|nr:MAG: hypothetical protein EAY68_05020 [Bacteroidota bacterium]